MPVPETLEYHVTDPTKPVRILRNPSDRKETAVEPITVPALLKRTAENYGSTKAMVYQDLDKNEWVSITYKQYRERVEKMAKVFIKLGLERHGVVAVLAFNSVEWFVSELAAIQAGGVIAGVYTTNSVDSVLHVLESSRANIVIVDEPKQMDKIKAIKEKLPHLKAVVQTQAPFAEHIRSSDGYWRWSEVEAMDTDDVEDEYKKRLAQIKPNECCCMVYTSGTVGLPKGAMLSHDNFVYDSYALSSHIDISMGKETIVSYLPLSHVAAQIVDIFTAMTIAGTIYFADKDVMKGSLVKTLLAARPTQFLGVPRIYEKLAEKLYQTLSNQGAIKRLLGGWARSVTLNHHMDRMGGLPSNSVQYKLAQKMVTSKIKQALGFDRTKTFLTGAAPLSVETKKFFLGLDIPILEAFGMSETTGAHTMSNINQTTFETIGRQLPGFQTKIINPNEVGHGEICVKGRNIFMGYVNDEEKTAEAFIEDNWMKTGDLGYIDGDGYIFITGRIKELIITAGGENIPPVLIENNLKAECPAISNAILIGDRRKFLSILVTLKTEMNADGSPGDALGLETLNWLNSLGLKSYKQLSEVLAAGPDAAVMQGIQEALNRANKKAISNAQKVQKFAILPNDFSIPTGELGPTMKLKRNVVLEKYSEVIEKFYK